jgi:hypothetical protein
MVELLENQLGVLDAQIDGGHLTPVGKLQVFLGGVGAEKNAILGLALANLALLFGANGRESCRFLALDAQLFLALGAIGGAQRDARLADLAMAFLGVLGRHGVAALAHTFVVGPALDSGRRRQR